ncbi:hypothetical protein ACSVCE_11705 [Chromobacterium haemolyticum]|uniref:hypothetical protein n=1 Tax=Chromobacterium TaxID=535 RepID=UPI0020BDB3F6|nr:MULTISPECIES: hypothetical protein [Chromobacterium]MDH0340914.1 hypothetical protein [Chromobacterium haemolyticum]
MAAAISAFSITKRDIYLPESRDVEYTLLYEGADTGIKSIYYHDIVVQYQLMDGCFFVVLKNEHFEITNYAFYLLGKGLSTLDCVEQYQYYERDGFMTDKHFSGKEFVFKRSGNSKKYSLKIDGKGKIFYSLSDFKGRPFFDFFRLRKYLLLTEV